MRTADILSRRNNSTNSFISNYEMLTWELLPASPLLLDKIRTKLRQDPPIAKRSLLY